MRRNERNKLVINIFLLLFVLLIFFAFLEISLRLFSYPSYGFQKGVFVRDSVIGYKLSADYQGTQSIYGKAYELRTNNKGLRDFREYGYQKGEANRIVILGDSFAFGNGVDLDESYPENLRNLFGEEVEIINLGVPGYGINNQYLSFIKEGIKYDPDIILIGYIVNDWNIHQVLLNEKNEYVIDGNHSAFINDVGLMTSEAIGLRSMHLSLLYNFRSYSFFYTNFRSVLSKIIDKYWTNVGVPAYFSNSDSHEYRVAYNGYYSILKMLKEHTSGKIVIFIGPTLDDLFSSEEIQESYNINYEVNAGQTKDSVEEIAKLLDIEVIRVESSDPSIYLEVDGHWNSKGNKLMADKLHERLKNFL
jgi:lysophospholipase L1-like esterase